MDYSVYLTADAEKDLYSIYDYISENDSTENAIYVVKKVEEVVNSLKQTPERGSNLRELSKVGVNIYKELYFKPYRIIYRVIDQSVYVMLIADGRRNLQTLLERRLFK